MRRDFFMEIEVEKDGKIVTLDTDDMDMNIYQKINGEKVRIFEIICFHGTKVEGQSGAMTVAEFVGRRNYDEINVEAPSENVLTIYSDE